MRTTPSRKSKVFFGAVLLALTGLPLQARERWDCSYEGGGAAHYVTRLERHGDTLVEPHWSYPLAYRILVDRRDLLIAVQAAQGAPSFRSDAAGTFIVIILDKLSGRMRRSTGAGGDAADQIEFGRCERS